MKRPPCPGCSLAQHSNLVLGRGPELRSLAPLSCGQGNGHLKGCDRNGCTLTKIKIRGYSKRVKGGGCEIGMIRIMMMQVFCAKARKVTMLGCPEQCGQTWLPAHENHSTRHVARNATRKHRASVLSTPHQMQKAIKSARDVQTLRIYTLEAAEILN